MIDTPDPNATIPLGRASIRWYPRVIAATAPATPDSPEVHDVLHLAVCADHYAAEREFQVWIAANPTTLVHRFVIDQRIVAGQLTDGEAPGA